MGFLNKKDSQWERVNKNIDGAAGNLSRIGREGEGERKRFSFLGRRGGDRE